MIVLGNFNFCMIQETKCMELSKRMIRSIYMGRDNFDWVCKNASGQPGGLLCVWRASQFDIHFSFSGKHFIGICVKQQDTICYSVNVYSACNMVGIWDELRGLK